MESNSGQSRRDHLSKYGKYTKYSTPAALTFIGLAFLAAALWLLPAPGQTPNPASTIVYVDTKIPVNYFKYQVNVKGPGEYSINVLLLTSPASVAAGSTATVDIFIPKGLQFGDCARLGFADCQRRPETGGMGGLPGVAGEWTIKPSATTGGAYDLSVSVSGNNFGYTNDDVQESVAMPDVVFSNTQVNCELDIVYVALPDSQSYDWSSFPTALNTTSFASWIEQVSNGIAPARIVVGINHAAQERNDRYTFIAGAFVGVAGGALIGALQELMHAWADGSKGNPRRMQGERPAAQ